MSDVYQHYRKFWTPEYWQTWSERSDDRVQSYRQGREKQLCAELLEVPEGATVLEAGCGYGRISRVILEKPIKSLVGIDLSGEMVETCKQTLKERFLGSVGNIEKLPFADGTFDAVVCSGVLMHLKSDSTALAELMRVLRKGGMLVISFNNVYSPLSPFMMLYTALRRDYVQRFRSPRFFVERLAKAGFSGLRMRHDTILGVRLRAPWLKTSLPPQWSLPLVKELDRLSDNTALKFLGFELWLSAKKAG